MVDCGVCVVAEVGDDVLAVPLLPHAKAQEDEGDGGAPLLQAPGTPLTSLLWLFL